VRFGNAMLIVARGGTRRRGEWSGAFDRLFGTNGRVRRDSNPSDIYKRRKNLRAHDWICKRSE